MIGSVVFGPLARQCIMVVAFSKTIHFMVGKQREKKD
jgi:hypothetical protein